MRKKIDPRLSDVRRTKGSGNVFLDLGYDPAEAKIMTMRAEPPEPLRDFGAVGRSSAQLAQVDSLVARYREEKHAGRILPNTIQASRIALTYHSNAIEGNTLSLRETQLVIEGKTPPGTKDLREIYEARNHDRAIQLIESWVSGPVRPYAERDLLDVHSAVLADIEPASAGRFRDGRVLIAGTGYVPPGSQKFDLLIPALLELANRAGVHPVIQSAEFHYNLVAVHPFNDGNGRTARLMMNYLLLRAGYPYAILEVTQRAAYLAALDEANRGRIEPFVDLMVSCVLRSLKSVMGD